MPPKPLHAPRKLKVNDEALALYANLKAIKLAGMHDVPNHLGGKKTEYWKGGWKLNRLLGLDKNIQSFNPVETDTPNPPDYMQHNRCAYDQWVAGWNARCQLENELSVSALAGGTPAKKQG